MTLLRKLYVICALVVATPGCANVNDPTMENPDLPDDMSAGQTRASDHERGRGKPRPGRTAIPLELWVDDLIENHTTDRATPDTVHDKKISDTEDPSLFDHYFAETE